MHDIFGREDFESFSYLYEILDRLRLIQRSLFFNFVFKGASVAELIEEVEIVSGFEDFDEFDNVRGINFG